ncbi:hypothetical protein V2A60_002841 [Cordyceps javanica]|uniref:Uncharacterized protein n=1 Tax=Cordyceps javanica TaxID=43265 RepID=A0A545UX99_9HYPO|nr:hypothetical protein IF1G_06971 [Cordyceps javanica]
MLSTSFSLVDLPQLSTLPLPFFLFLHPAALGGSPLHRRDQPHVRLAQPLQALARTSELAFSDVERGAQRGRGAARRRQSLTQGPDLDPGVSQVRLEGPPSAPSGSSGSSSPPVGHAGTLQQCPAPIPTPPTPPTPPPAAAAAASHLSLGGYELGFERLHRLAGGPRLPFGTVTTTSTAAAFFFVFAFFGLACQRRGAALALRRLEQLHAEPDVVHKTGVPGLRLLQLLGYAPQPFQDCAFGCPLARGGGRRGGGGGGVKQAIGRAGGPASKSGRQGDSREQRANS